MKTTILSRPVLADKLQFHVSPDFLSIDYDIELYYDGHLSPFFEKDVQSLYDANIVYFDKRPYLHLPNDFNFLTSDYIWNTRIGLRKPFTVTFDFNFIRNILSLIKNKNDSGYNEKYHASIQLHDDNYIDKNIWSKWDDIIILDIVSNIKYNCLAYADTAFRYLIEDHDLDYSIISLKHAEFNIDYNVGPDNSLPLILAFSRFIYSDRGLQWRSEIESISMVQRSNNNDFDRTITSQDGHDGHTFKFNITKGLSLKIYQKTTDHVRIELVYEKSFIRQRFHTFSFDKVYQSLYDFSKELFKAINFEGILYLLSKEINDNKSNVEMKINDILTRYDAELSHIVNAVINSQSISDFRSISRIKGDNKLRCLFKSTLDDKGHRVYSYNPYKTQKRFRRLKPPCKTKIKPARCPSCQSFYHTDLVRCPYCSDKNPDHQLSDSKGFNDFMKKVYDYKERGYSGF